MITTAQSQQPPSPANDEDVWRYGWRYVHRPLPLDTDRMYLTQTLRAQLEPSGLAVVLSGVRIVWDVPDLYDRNARRPPRGPSARLGP